MELSTVQKRRFCKNFSVPIVLFEEPYFSERIELFDKQYGCKSLYEEYKTTLETLAKEREAAFGPCKEDTDAYNILFEEIYTKAADFIKENERFQEFNECDMSQFAVNLNLPSSSIFSGNYVNHDLISVDMKKANFSTLKKLGVITDDTYDEFLSRFTNVPLYFKSKRLREIIFGQTNPKRLGTYEKYLMKQIYDEFVSLSLDKYVVFFSNDEIVLDVTNVDIKPQVVSMVQGVVDNFADNIPLHFENFTLKRVVPINGYVKLFADGSYKIKATKPEFVPAIIRMLENEPLTHNDVVYEFEPKVLAEFKNLHTLRFE